MNIKNILTLSALTFLCFSLNADNAETIKNLDYRINLVQGDINNTKNEIGRLKRELDQSSWSDVAIRLGNPGKIAILGAKVLGLEAEKAALQSSKSLIK